MLVRGDDLPVVVGVIGKLARITAGGRGVLAKENVRAVITGSEIHVVGDNIFVRVPTRPS